MALRTSVATGLWSAVGTWDTGVPVDTDTFLIAAGHTVTFDVDQSAFVGLGTSTIAATGTLIASTTAGAYVLKMNGDLTVNGTLRAGTSVAVPYPATCVFTVNYSSGAYQTIINNTTGLLLLYCVEPTYKFVTTTAQEPALETVIAYDNTTIDLTTDIWAVGNTIVICDLLPVGTSTRDSEEHTINAVGAGTITLNVGLTNQKEIGAKIILISRNIRLINSTNYIIVEGNNCHVAAEFYNFTGGGINGLDNSTVGGSMLMPSGESDRCFSSCQNLTITGAYAQAGSTGNSLGTVSLQNVTFSAGSIFAGFSIIFNSLTACSISAQAVSATLGYSACYACEVLGEIQGCQYSLTTSFDFNISADIANATRCLTQCSSFVISNCELGKSIGGVTTTTGLYRCINGRLSNVELSATTEFSAYNTALFRRQSSYIESLNHDGIVNAYKAWCLGGVVSSQTASPPTGYTIWYELACESTDYPVFRQYQTVVLPGTAIEVEGLIRIADANDHTAYPPRLQIIDAFADPLVDDTQSPLDESQIAVPDGSDSSWQPTSCIFANQLNSPVTVIVRMIAKHASGDVQTVWNVAGYQDQIADIQKRVKRLSAGSEV